MLTAVNSPICADFAPGRSSVRGLSSPTRARQADDRARFVPRSILEGPKSERARRKFFPGMKNFSRDAAPARLFRARRGAADGHAPVGTVGLAGPLAPFARVGGYPGAGRPEITGLSGPPVRLERGGAGKGHRPRSAGKDEGNREASGSASGPKLPGQA
jgi:hypothetical protein